MSTDKIKQKISKRDGLGHLQTYDILSTIVTELEKQQNKIENLQEQIQYIQNRLNRKERY